MKTVYRDIMALLTRRERWQFHALILATSLVGLVDVFSVAAILPFLAVIADPSLVASHPILSFLHDTLGGDSESGFLIRLGLLLFFIVLLSISLRAVSIYFTIRFSRLRGLSIATRLFAKYLQHDYSRQLHEHSADLARRMLDEVRDVVNGPLVSAIRVVSDLFVVLLLVTLLIIVEPVAAVSTAALLVLGYGTVFVFLRNRIKELSKSWSSGNAERHRIAQEAFGGFREVKVFNLEESYIARYRRPATSVAKTVAKIATYGELPRHVLEALAFGGMLLFIIWLLITQGHDITTMVPVIGLYAFAGIRLLPLVQKVYASWTSIEGGMPMMAAIADDLREAEMQKQKSELIPKRAVAGMENAVEFKNVTFRYPRASKDALKSLSLTIEAGSTVGIVGSTGAGKTTLIDILLGLLPPSDGSLRVDNIRIDETRVDSWRNQIGYVPQSIFLTADSIAANIAFGIASKEIDMDRVADVVRIAQLSDTVAALPNGLSTLVGERGVRLSGGQRQRIGIARALYRKPRLLILDEATSALDNVTESAVIGGLHAMAYSNTVVMIAHRLTTLKQCDIIHVMKHGRLISSGFYRDLATNDPEFQAFLRAAE